MRLEAVAASGRDLLKLQPTVKANVVDTTALVHRVFERRKANAASDLAFSAHRYLAEGLVQVAIDEAKRLGVDVVCFLGGVAYNEHITQTIRHLADENGLYFVVHNSIPAGDSGVSFGQSATAAWQTIR